MAKIIITGRGPVTVSRRIAQEVYAFKLDPAMLPNAIYSGDGFLVEKRDIKAVVVNDHEDNAQESGEGKKDENEIYYLNQEKDYREDIKRKCLTNWQEKAKHYSQYETIYRSLGKEPTPEFREKVLERQTDYFSKNQRHPFAIIEIKDLLPSVERGSEMHISGIIPSRVINLAYTSMYTALDTAKKMNCI